MSFKTPTSVLIVGPSGCGKTVFVTKLLRNAHLYFENSIPNIHYCYGIWQNRYSQMKKFGVQFHQGIPTAEDLSKMFDKTKGGYLVLDDLMAEGGNDQRMSDLFTKDSHHRNITVLYLCQDMFPPGKYAKTISRNAHYIIAFQNARDQLGFKNLLLQAFPSFWQDVLDVYEKETRRPYAYLMLDFHPHSDNNLRVYTDILKEEGLTRAFAKPQNKR